MQRFPDTARIFEFGDPILQELDYAARVLPVEFALFSFGFNPQLNS